MNIRQLEDNGYMILNGVIKDISIVRDDTKLVLIISINGDGWSVDYGGYDLNDDSFMGVKSLIGLLSTLDVSNLYDIKGKNVRIAAKLEDPVTIIGNIIYDKWFDYNDYKVYPSDLDDANNTEENSEEVIEEPIEEVVEE